MKTTCPTCGKHAQHMHNRCVWCHVVLKRHKSACECGNEDTAVGQECESCGRVRRS